MAPLQVEIVTERGCTGPNCERCRETLAVLKEVMTSGVSRVLNALNPLRPSTPFTLEHRTCIERPDVCSEASPPAVRLDGEIVLAGPGWTEADVRDAVTTFIARPITPQVEPDMLARP